VEGYRQPHRTYEFQMMLLTRWNDKLVARDKFAAIALLVVPNKHDCTRLDSKDSPDIWLKAVLCQ
jgi:hypothetical protein